MCVFVFSCLNLHSQHRLLLLARRHLRHPALLAHPPPWQGLPSCSKAVSELDWCISRLFVPSFWTVVLLQLLRIEGRPSRLLFMCRSCPAALNTQPAQLFLNVTGQSTNEILGKSFNGSFSVHCFKCVFQFTRWFLGLSLWANPEGML